MMATQLVAAQSIPAWWSSAHALHLMSDGATVAVYQTPGGNSGAVYAIQAAGTTTWPAGTFFAASFGNNSIESIKIPTADAIVGFKPGQSGYEDAFLLQYNATTKVITATVYSTGGQSGLTYNNLAAAWDPDHSLLHVMGSYGGATLQAYHVTLGSSPSVTSAYTLTTGLISTSDAAMAYLSNTLYLFTRGNSGGGSAATASIYTVAVSASAYGAVSGLTALRASDYQSGNLYGAAMGIDAATTQPYAVWASGSIFDIVFALYNGSSWTVTTIVPAAASSVYADSVVSAVGVNYDVYYRSITTQASGEIYHVQRTGGVWGTPAAVAGASGDATGYSAPTVQRSLPAGATSPLGWIQGTGSTLSALAAGGALGTSTPSLTLTASPNSITTAANITIRLTGTNTAWSTSSATQFTLSGGTGASIVSQSASSATGATLVINPGTAPGTLTITEPGGATTTITVPTTPALFLFTVATSSAPGIPSQPYSLKINGTASSPVTLTFADGGAGGTFTPSSVTLPATANPSGTVTYTPSTAPGPRLVALTVLGSGGLTTAEVMIYRVN